MKYIRTKDGIFEVDTLSIHYIGETHFSCWNIEHTRVFNEWHIIKQADTIEELLQEGDLVCERHIYFHELEKDREEYWKATDGSCVYKEDITSIYTKQGNDYILRASKNEKGEWKLL